MYVRDTVLIKLKSFNKKICISSDHAGYNVKEYIKIIFKNKISLIDLGPHNNKSVDYPDYAKKVAKRIKQKKSDFGILVAAQVREWLFQPIKSRGVRAAVCYNKTSTYLCRSHNNANILCIGARLTKKNSIWKNVSSFFKYKF